MRSLYIKTLVLITVLVFGLPTLASAGTLSLFPATGSFEQGKTFSVRVTMSSPDQAINAASGAISFPTDKLHVSSISKSDSVLTLWVQDPSFSNSQGTINFEGVVPNPGFTGVNGSAILITFKVVGQGTALVKFDSGTLLANDGQGTNIVKDLNGASYTLVKPSLQTPELTPPEPNPELAPVVESIKAPTITDYPKKLEESSPLKIHGTTYGNASVTLSLKDSRGQIFTQITQSNDIGDFSILWPNKVDAGDYELTGVVTYKGIKSLPSDVLSILIISTSPTRLKYAVIDYTSLIIIAILCSALIIAILLYLFRSFIRFKRKLWRDASDAERSMHTEFDDLKESVRKELLIFEDVQTRRDLTKEESLVLEKITRHIARIEKNIDRKIDTVKKDLK